MQTFDLNRLWITVNFSYAQCQSKVQTGMDSSLISPFCNNMSPSRLSSSEVCNHGHKHMVLCLCPHQVKVASIIGWSSGPLWWLLYPSLRITCENIIYMEFHVKQHGITCTLTDFPCTNMKLHEKTRNVSKSMEKHVNFYMYFREKC